MIPSRPNDPLAEEESGVSVPLLGESQALSKPAVGTGTLVAVGTFWLVLQTLGTKVVALGGQLILAWLLSPEAFGQIGMAYTVTSFVSLLINPGIDVILVRRGVHFRLWSTPAFYFSLSTALLGSLVIFAVAPLVARLYGAPELVGLLAVLAFATPLGALQLVPTAKLRSQMRFRELAGVNLFQTVLQTAMTVGFAAAGFGIYSFVLPVPLIYLAVAAMLWFIARPTIRLNRPFQYWKYLIGDSSYIFGTSLLQTIVGQGDYIILGALYGDAVLGPYFFAFGIATQAIRLTAGSLQLVLMAGLTRLPAYSVQQTQAALRATKTIAMCGVPLCMIQSVVAGPLLRLLYDSKWIEAIPLIQLLSLGMAFDVMSWPATSLLRSRGQFRFLYYWSCVFAPIFIIAVFAGAIWGEGLGVAITVSSFYAAFSPALAFYAFRTSDVAWPEILGMYFRPILVGLIAAGASFSAIQIAGIAGWHPALQCGVSIGAGLVSMGFSARVLMPSSWHEIEAKTWQVFGLKSAVGR